MARVALVVADGAAMSAGDTAIENVLTAAGHTVTRVNDESAIDTTVDVHLITESGSPTNLAAKYAGLSVPVVSCEVGGWDDLSWANANATNQGSGQTFNFSGNIPAIEEGQPGNPVTVFTASVGRFGLANTAVASGATVVATHPTAGANSWLCFALEVGAALFSGNAAARGVALGIIDNAAALMNADTGDLIISSIDWALSYRPRGVHHTTQYNGFF